MNFAGLSWFFKIDGIGHFWYVTLILAFYFGIFILTNMRLAVVSKKPLMVLPIIFCGILVQLLMARVGIKQNYIMVFLILGVLFFMYGDRILNMLERSGKAMVPVSLSVLAAACAAMVLMQDKECYCVRSWLQAVIGMSVVSLVVPWLKSEWKSSVVAWVAGISFDVYLVHSLFRYPCVVKLCPNDLVYFLVYMSGSFIVAVLLRWYRTRVERLVVGCEWRSGGVESGGVTISPTPK